MQQQKNKKKPVGVRDEGDVNIKEEPFPELEDPFADNRGDDGNLEGCNLEYTDQVIQQLRSGVSEDNFEDPELAAAIAASLEMMNLDDNNKDQNKENLGQEEEQKVPQDDKK